jgi:CRISPR/Cas system CMR-associated protein Cmr5 small subunit
MNSRTIEYASKQENVDVNSKITITAYCLAVNETGTSNWVISGNNISKKLIIVKKSHTFNFNHFGFSVEWTSQ